jgi:hypothetical protein
MNYRPLATYGWMDARDYSVEGLIPAIARERAA